MSNLFVCSVFDSALGAYSRPFFVPSTGMAVRSFSDEVNRPGEDNPMFAHSEDFVLFQLAQFDDFDGTFDDGGSPPIMLVRAKDVKRA